MNRVRLVALIGLCMGLGMQLACTAPAGDNAPDDSVGNGQDGDGGGQSNSSGGSSQPAVVKTRIVVGNADRIDVGDDLIVYGVSDDANVDAATATNANYNQPTGVFYFTPSIATDQTDSATMIPGSDLLFNKRDFAVTGRKVVLVRSTGAVTVFDTSQESMLDIPSNDIRLHADIPGAYDMPGQMMVDGPYVVTINESGDVADGNAIKVIDLSMSPPAVISLANPVGELDEIVTEFTQVAVDESSRRVAAAGAGFQNDLYVWDLNAPDQPAERFDFGANEFGLISDRTQMRLDGDFVIYHNDLESALKVQLLNLTNAAVTVLNESVTEARVRLREGKVGYFMFEEQADQEDAPSTLQLRSVIGAVENTGALTRASQLDEYPVRTSNVDLSSSAGAIFTQDDCIGPKRVGYGETMAITPDGSRWFIAGWANPTLKDYVLMSTGGAFEDLADPEQSTISGSLQGADVVASSNTVAFRGLRETGDGTGCISVQDWVVSFIVLDRLPN